MQYDCVMLLNISQHQDDISQMHKIKPFIINKEHNDLTSVSVSLPQILRCFKQRNKTDSQPSGAFINLSFIEDKASILYKGLI